MSSKLNSAQILDQVIQRQASDLHVVVGVAPFLRVSTRLSPIEGYEAITNEDVEYFLSQLTYFQILPLKKSTSQFP